MTFLEMKAWRLAEIQTDPRVQLVAGLRADRDAPWEVYCWPWPALQDESLMLRLDSLHARHATAIREGCPLPWFVRGLNEAVLYIRAEEPGAQVIPLPVTPTLMDPEAVSAVLASEARSLVAACRAFAAKLEHFAGRLDGYK